MASLRTILNNIRPHALAIGILILVAPSSEAFALLRPARTARNQLVVVQGRTLINRNVGPPDRKTMLLVFQRPNTLIRLATPVTLTQLLRDSLTFQCDEVGWFPDESGSQDWTMGKNCRLLEQPAPKRQVWKP